jgi:predicted transcriptional regulator
MKQVIVGGTLREASARTAAAWKRAERGQFAEADDTVTFVSWSALSSVMTDKRHELLQLFRASSTNSIRELSGNLGRDFKRVHEEVSALARIGLIERAEDVSLTTGYSKI